jgi:hypothetical protein
MVANDRSKTTPGRRPRTPMRYAVAAAVALGLLGCASGASASSPDALGAASGSAGGSAVLAGGSATGGPSQTSCVVLQSDQEPDLTNFLGYSLLADDPLEKDFTYDDGQERLTYVIKDGEATVTAIAKSSDCATDTYTAYIPDALPDATGKTYLVTAIGANALGTSGFVAENGIVSNVTTNDEIAGVSLPAKILSIEKQAFIGCTALTSVEFRTDTETGQNNLETIGDQAFMMSSVESLLLPDSVTEVGDCAFRQIGSLKTLKFPATQTTWGVDVFGYTESMETVEIPYGCRTIPYLVSTECKELNIPATCEGDVHIRMQNTEKVDIDPNAKITMLHLNFGSTESISIPSSVKTLSLVGSCLSVEIPEGVENLKAFMVKGISKITVPNSVEKIGGLAFCNVSTLEEVSFSDESKLITIGDGAFQGCERLKNIVLPESLLSIGYKAFEDCNSLEEVRIPDQVSYLGSHLFCDCDNLSSIYFGSNSSIRQLLNTLASDCPSLKRVVLSETLQGIGDFDETASASQAIFVDCPSLQDIYIYNQDLRLSTDAFKNCGEYAIHCFGTSGEVVDFAESNDIRYVPFAELDGNEFSGCCNVLFGRADDGSLLLTCEEVSDIGIDYSWCLIEGEDYYVEDSSSSGASLTRITGNDLTVYGAINLPHNTDISCSSIEMEDCYWLVGEVCRPEPIVTLDGITLENDADYTLEYRNNTSSGTGFVTITGCGIYSGSCERSFGIRSCRVKTIETTQDASIWKIPDSATRAYVVWNYDYANMALCSLLASHENAGLITASKASLSDAQLATLSNAGIKECVVVGDRDFCSSDVSHSITSANLAVSLVCGDEESNSLSLREAKEKSTSCVIANPEQVETLAIAASVASSLNADLIFTQSDGRLSLEAEQAVSEYQGAYLIGDYASADAQLDNGDNVVRVYGADITETSIGAIQSVCLSQSSTQGETVLARESSVTSIFIELCARNFAGNIVIINDDNLQSVINACRAYKSDCLLLGNGSDKCFLEGVTNCLTCVP